MQLNFTIKYQLTRAADYIFVLRHNKFKLTTTPALNRDDKLPQQQTKFLQARLQNLDNLDILKVDLKYINSSGKVKRPLPVSLRRVNRL